MVGFVFLVLRSRVDRPALMSGTLAGASNAYRGGRVSGVGVRTWPFSFGLRETLDSNIVCSVFL